MLQQQIHDQSPCLWIITLSKYLLKLFSPLNRGQPKYSKIITIVDSTSSHRSSMTRSAAVLLSIKRGVCLDGFTIFIQENSCKVIEKYSKEKETNSTEHYKMDLKIFIFVFLAVVITGQCYFHIFLMTFEYFIKNSTIDYFINFLRFLGIFE